MIGLILRPIRRRKAIAALAAYSEAKDAYRRAIVSGDTRRQHETLRVMTEAMGGLLRAEMRLERVSGSLASLVPTEGRSSPCGRQVAS